MGKKMKISKDLKIFLKKEGILKEFEDNVRAASDYYGYTIEDPAYGFLWKDTPQGLQFWWRLCYKFNSI